MHLVKWFRKNMGKLMAIFVILIMIAFIMPSVLNQLAKPRTAGARNAMWLYGKDKEITVDDVRQATAELSVLNGLSIDEFLFRQRDLRLILLGRLLFPKPEQAADLSDAIKTVSFQGQFSISLSEIDDFFSQTRGRPEILWILLKSEARQAGCVVLPEQAADILNSIIPQITNNQVDAATAVNKVCSANNMADAQGLAAFADVLSIIIYTRIVSDVEDVTEPQLENIFARAKEKINAEFVQFNAEDFLDKVSEPDKSQIIAQFEKYKNYLPGEITDDNPCGFGYKLSPRVAMDYIIVKLEDVEKLVARPTEEETEDFYQRNLESFTEQIPVDANDPNSKAVTKQKSYAEVADIIKEGLYAQKVSLRCTEILNKAVEQAEAGLESLDFEKAGLEEFKSKAGDYKTSAEVASKEYGVKLYTGRTAMLTAEEIQSDPYLGSLLMTGQSRRPVRLVRLAFAVTQLGNEATKLGPFDPPAPKMYVSFGPLVGQTGDIMAMVRVVETVSYVVPENIEFSYKRNLPKISESSEAEAGNFVLKDIVAKDCKKLEGMKIAKKAAEEFLGMVKKQSWDAALQKINTSYGKKNSAEPNEKTFVNQTWDGKNRISQMDIEMLKMKASNLSGAEGFINENIIYAKLANVFYQKFKDIEAAKEKLPVIIEFKPQLSCYAVKNLTCNFGAIEEYENIRQELAFQRDYAESQSMAIKHLMPDNINKRLNLRPVHEPNKPAGPNSINGENQ